MKKRAFRSRLFAALISVGFAAILFSLAVSGLLLHKVTQGALSSGERVNREMLEIVRHGFWQSELFSYEQALNHAGIMLEGAGGLDDAALLKEAARAYGDIRDALSEVFFLARDGRIVAAYGGGAAMDVAALGQMLADARLVEHFGARDLSELLREGMVGYNSEVEGTPLLAIRSARGTALLGVFVPRAQAEGMLVPLNQLGEDMNAAARERVEAEIKAGGILLASFCLLLTIAIALISRKLSAGVSLPVEREQARQRALIEQAEAVDRIKTELLGNIAHELKTPLTVVSSRVQQARAGLSPEETGRELSLIEGEVCRMASMISQILDVSRIEEGRMRMNIRRESIVEIIQTVLDDYHPAFSRGGTRLSFRKDGNVPPVLCDRARITQVLVNLIGNAARHARGGRIGVFVRAEGGFAQIAVADNGEGIAPEQLPRLFDRYHSGAGAGAGLGLYIARHIVEAHAGRIWIESEPGSGTRAHFTLPLDSEP